MPKTPDADDRLEALAEARRLLTPRLRYIPKGIELTPAQIAFCLLNRDEVFFGGAAGGGKTYALLSAALQYVDVPGYSAICIRKTYDLLAQPGQLLALSKDWLSGTDAKWNETRKRWTFPSGATLSFRFMEVEADMLTITRGPSYQFICFDELTDFPEDWYLAMFQRLRRPLHGTGAAHDGLSLDLVPLRMRSGSNPGGPGHVWVKQRFVTQETRAEGVAFIPSTLYDNTKIDQESYLRGLRKLSQLDQKRMIEGDWSVSEEGTMFQRGDFDVREHAPGTIVGSIRFWDLAGTKPKPGKRKPDYTVGLRLDRLDDNRVYISDIMRLRDSPAEVERAILQKIAEDGPLVPVALELEGGGMARMALDALKRRIGGRARVSGEPPQGSKAERARDASTMTSNGNVSIRRARFLRDFLDEAESFPIVDHDDQIDAFSGALKKLPEWRPRHEDIRDVIRRSQQQDDMRGESGYGQTPVFEIPM